MPNRPEPDRSQVNHTLPPHSDDRQMANNQARSKLAARRDVLKLGATGLPMVLTLKASAQQAVISQLQCAFRLPARMRIMVNANGHAWASTTHNVRFNRRRQAYRKDDLDEFLRPGNSIEFTGGVPSSYIPSGCSSPPTGNWVDCGWNKFSINRNARITPGNFYNPNGGWTLTGNKGLYVALSIQYAGNGTSGNWPGISCIVSILNYLD